jgi:hypothetical protein
MPTRARPAPKGLGSAGAKLWKGIAGNYELRADEVRLLEDASKIADAITQLEDAMRGEPLLVKGGNGQLTLHPLLVAQQSHRTALASLLKQLRLPEVVGRPNPHREAARARWDRIAPA